MTLRANVESINVGGTSGLTDGTITFRDLGPTIENGESGVLLGSGAPFRNANGGVSSTLSLSNLSGGKHNITVRYSGTFPAAGASEPPLRASTAALAQVVVNNQTVAFTSSPGARAAYGADYTPTFSATSGLPVTISVDAAATGVCFIDPASAPTVKFRAEGTCVLNADQAGSTDFFAAPRVHQSFPVAFGTAPQQQVITFTSTPPTNPVEGTVYEVSAVGGASGNPVTFYGSSVFGSCSQTGPTTIRVDNGGYCTIFASQAGGPGFQAATARQDLFIPAFPQSIYFRTQPPATMAVGDVYTVQASVSTRRLATFGTGVGSSACTVVRVPPTPVGNEISYATVTATRTGPCVVTAQEITNDIYRTPSPLIQQSFLIGTPQTVEFSSTAPGDATVGGTYSPITRSATPNGAKPVTLTSATPATCSVSGGAVSFVGAGTCTLRADQDGTDVYAPAPRVTQTFTIAPAAQVVEFLSAAPDPMVDDTYEPQVSGGASSKPVVVTSGTPDTCEISDGIVTFTGVGACALVAAQAADADYTAAISVVQRVTVRGFAQEIAVTTDAPADAVVGDSYTPIATGGASGEPVVTGVRTPQVCSVEDGVVSFTRAGSCVVVLSQAGTSRYAVAADVTQTVEVGKASQTLEFTSADPRDAAVDGTYTPTVTGGDSSSPIVIGISTPDTCEVSDGVVTFTGVGDCTVTADQAGNGDYTAAPQVAQTIAVRALAQEIVVSSDAPTGAVVGDSYTPIATGGASGAPVVTGVRTPQVCSAADGLVSFIGAGSCVVVLSQAGTSRYAAAADVTQTVEVGKASQTMKFTSTAPDEAAVDGTYEPRVSGGGSSMPVVVSSGTPDTCEVSDGVVTFTGVGDCTVTADQAGNGDYTAAPQVAQTIAVHSAVDPEQPSVCAAVVSVGSAPTVKEPAAGTVDLVFPLTVTNASGCGDLTVSTSVSGGTASAGSDFTVPSSPLVLRAGATTGELKVPVLADPDVEPDETVVLVLSGVAGDGNPTMGARSGAGTITDDDVAVVIPVPAVDPVPAVPIADLVPATDPIPAVVPVGAGVVVEPLAACRIGAPVPAGYVQVKGTPGPDRLLGSPKKEIFYGGAGDDRIDGRGGDDIICGRAGDDTLIGGSGNDQLSGAFGNDHAFGGSGNDRLISAAGDDRLVGGSGNDQLAGRSGDDRLLGGTGDDRLAGGSGTDMLAGGQGTDVFDRGRD